MYKLIALDIDGTLINSQDKITKNVKIAIQKARDVGVHVVLCTGRSLYGIQEFLQELDMKEPSDYAITYNGALVQNNFTKEAVVRKPLSEAEVRSLLQVATDLNLNHHFFNQMGAFTTLRNIPKHMVFECYYSRVPMTYLPAEEINGEYTKFNISAKVDEEFQSIHENQLQSLYDKFAVTRTFPFWVEITSKKATKGNAIKALAAHLGIGQDEIIAVGDGLNDLTMVEYAGLGVAVGNGADCLKNIADYVAPSNDEDGVAHVINKFLLA